MKSRYKTINTMHPNTKDNDTQDDSHDEIVLFMKNGLADAYEKHIGPFGPRGFTEHLPAFIADIITVGKETNKKIVDSENMRRLRAGEALVPEDHPQVVLGEVKAVHKLLSIFNDSIETLLYPKSSLSALLEQLAGSASPEELMEKLAKTPGVTDATLIERDLPQHE